MQEFVESLTLGSDVFTPYTVVAVMALTLALECIASIINSLVKGVR